MRLSRALEEKKLDVRLRDKLVHEGTLTKSEVDEYLNSLPDDESRATTSADAEAKRIAPEGSYEN
jgi:hypothetical protein